MRTRSGQRVGEGVPPPAEEAVLAVPESVEPVDSDDEAPEEVGFQQSKKSAAQVRSQERDAKRTVLEEQKKQRQRRVSKKAVEEENEVARQAEATLAGAEPDADLDYLPEEVLQDVAENRELHPRRTFEQAMVSQHLRSNSGKADRQKNRVLKLGVEEGASKKKKKGRRVGPVTVQVLANVQEDRLSVSAKAFLSQRQNKVQRSEAMLAPVPQYGIVHN